jgi:hypothetical protein|tara:strand:+ start:11651 stop:11767 length:117 start_codon:yes stop_codon:yes gene_type:complete
VETIIVKVMANIELMIVFTSANAVFINGLFLVNSDISD